MTDISWGASRRGRIRLTAALAVLAMWLTMAAAAANSATAATETADLDSIEPHVSAVGFTHPGVFNSLDNLTATKKRVLAGDAPWSDSFEQLAASAYLKRGSPDFSEFGSATASDPTKQACDPKRPGGCISVCGSFNVDPNVGCGEQQADARAVYAQSLMYWYTGDEQYARRAVTILNSYSKHFKGSTGSNGPLMTAWTAGQMVRGAELLRYTYKPASSKHRFDVRGFSSMLRESFVPTLTGFDYGRYNGNWRLSAAEGLMSVGVFLDDRRLYDQAVEMWRERTEAYIYLSTDGALPAAPANDARQYQTPTALRCQWLDGKAKACQSKPAADPGVRFQNGQAQEACRDFGHTAMGLGGIINTAETAWIQGEDLYGEEQTRIITGVLYAVQISQAYKDHGWPASFCGGADELNPSLSLVELPVHTVYNAYAVRKGVQMPAISIPGYPAPKLGSDPLADFIAAKGSARGYVGNVTAWDAVTHGLATATATPIQAPRTAVPAPAPAPDQADAGDAGPSVDRAPAMPLDVATLAFALVGMVATIILLAWAAWRFARRRRDRAGSASR